MYVPGTFRSDTVLLGERKMSEAVFEDYNDAIVVPCFLSIIYTYAE